MSQSLKFAVAGPDPVAAAVRRAGFHVEPACTLDGVMMLCLHGELDMATAPRAKAALRAALDARPSALTADLAGLSFIDSMGVLALVEAACRAASDGCSLVLRSPSRPVMKVLRLTGVEWMVAVEARSPTE